MDRIDPDQDLCNFLAPPERAAAAAAAATAAAAAVDPRVAAIAPNGPRTAHAVNEQIFVESSSTFNSHC